MTDQVGAFLAALAAWAAEALPHLIGAILILIIGWWFAGRTERGIKALLIGKTTIDPTFYQVIASIARYAILILVVIAFLSQLGIQTTSVIAALGAAGLAIGLAMQGTLSNIAAGLMLLWLRPFRVGDSIETGTIAGTVQVVGLFACELYSSDGVYQFVPNSELWNKRLTNYSRLPTRQIDIEFRLRYDEDVAKARRILLEAAMADPRSETQPPPESFVDKLNESAISLKLRVWVKVDDYWSLLRALNERGKVALEAAGFSPPHPQRDLHFDPAARSGETLLAEPETSVQAGDQTPKRKLARKPTRSSVR